MVKHCLGKTETVSPILTNGSIQNVIIEFMFEEKENLQQKIESLEQEMMSADFWNNKIHAQMVIKEIAELKEFLLGEAKYDKGDAVLSILSGAGGDDAEDFSAMLFHMYQKYCEKKGWTAYILNANENTQGGYRNISIEVKGKNAYGTLKNENGVHRLVRLSPFNAKAKRSTSFSLVEVLPVFEKGGTITLSPDDLKIEFSKAGGPGGQNVNKRETAVRIVHIPTNFSVAVATERSQEQNKERALRMLEAKLYKKQEEDQKKVAQGLSISKNTDIEWSNQIRNYILHPYKLVKDLRTGVETGNVDAVLYNGELDSFIEAEKKL